MDQSWHSLRMEPVVVSALRDYLLRHPKAADSLEGIRRWWLPASMQNIPLQQLKHALEAMIASGEVRQVRLPDGAELYACAGAAASAGPT